MAPNLAKPTSAAKVIRAESWRNLSVAQDLLGHASPATTETHLRHVRACTAASCGAKARSAH
jgi:integrase